MNEEFQKKFADLETTIQAENVSHEGLDFLIDRCVKASEGEINDLAIAVIAIARNLDKARDSCNKIHDWAVGKHGEEVVNCVIQVAIDKSRLEANLLLSN